MDRIFEPLGIPDPGRVIKLSAEMIDELVTLSLLAPLAVADLRAQFLPYIGATDASGEWMAAVRAPRESEGRSGSLSFQFEEGKLGQVASS